MKIHISYTKSFNVPVSIAFATLAHMINVYEICLNTTNYVVFNMQGVIYRLWTSILKLFWSADIPTVIVSGVFMAWAGVGCGTWIIVTVVCIIIKRSNSKCSGHSLCHPAKDDLLKLTLVLIDQPMGCVIEDINTWIIG